MAINNNIIVGLDIGTTKVCAIVGQMAENGKINVMQINWESPLLMLIMMLIFGF